MTVIDLIRHVFKVFKNINYECIISPYFGNNCQNRYNPPGNLGGIYEKQLETRAKYHRCTTKMLEIKPGLSMCVQDIFCMSFNVTSNVPAHMLEYFKERIDVAYNLCLAFSTPTAEFFDLFLFSFFHTESSIKDDSQEDSTEQSQDMPAKQEASAVADPQAIEPPVAEPPAIEPPVAEPPAAEPPAAEQPAAEQPAAEPPAIEPPVAEPPAAEPPAAEQPAIEPPVAEPPAALKKEPKKVVCEQGVLHNVIEEREYKFYLSRDERKVLRLQNPDRNDDLIERWVNIYLKVIQRLLRDVFLLEICYNNKGPDCSTSQQASEIQKHVYEISAFLNTWQGRALVRDQKLPFFDMEIKCTQSLLKDGTDRTFDDGKSFTALFEILVNKKREEFSLKVRPKPPQRVITKKSPLYAFFSALQNSLQQFNLKEYLKTVK